MKTFLGLSALIGFVAAAAAAEPFAWGINGHTLTQVGYRDVSIAEQLDLIKELGVTWYRVDFPASASEKQAARCEELLRETARRNIRVLPVLFSSPGPHSKAATPAQIRAGAFATASNIVARYRGRITHWELSNELDAFAMIHKGETNRNGQLWKWDGAPDGSRPEHYADIRYEKARAEIVGLQEGVKAADPKALTIVDTAGWLHYGFTDRLVKEDKAVFDIVSWHWYSEMGDMTKVQGKLDLIALLKGYGKPLWITEINHRNGSMGGKDAANADYLARVARQLRGNAAVEAFFVYELLDQPYFGADNGESHYGLVQLLKGADGRWRPGPKKPAFDAFKQRTETITQ